MTKYIYQVVNDYDGGKTYRHVDRKTWLYYVKEFGRSFGGVRGQAVDGKKISEIFDVYNPQGWLVATRTEA